MHIEYREDELSYQSHHHNTYEMILILQGQSRFSVRGRSFVASPGDVVCFSNLEEHATEIVSTPYHRYFIMLPPRRTDQMIGDARLLSIFKQRGAAFPYVLHAQDQLAELQALFEALLREAAPEQPWREERVGALLTLVLTTLCRAHPQAFPGAPPSQSLPLVQIQAHLDAHFAERFSLEDLARQHHVSPGYLSQCFREHAGFSPMQYVMLNRLTAACDLLVTQDLSVAQVAAATGFTDVNNFIRRFALHYGVTPNRMKTQRRTTGKTREKTSEE